MEVLFIEGNEKSPTVELNKDSGAFNFNGRSVPEDAQKFYRPILDWMDEYSLNPNDSTCISFSLDYFNTASSMMILAILLKLKPISKAGKEVLIKWHFDEEDMKDAGINYEEAVDIPFEHIGEVDDDF